jgi:FkbM family methyltransferase
MTMPSGLAHWIWRQRWLPLRLKKSAYKKLDAQGKAPDAPFAMDFYGLRYHGNLNNGIEFAMYFYGAFEKPLLYFLRDCLLNLGRVEAGGTVFCDVGANIGQHSLFMSQFASRVHAFEPYAAVSARLESHLELNHIDNVTLHKLGLGDSNGTLPFYAPTGSNTGIGSFAAESQRRGNTPAGALRIARGDEYLADLELPRIEVMKIDVEGFERKVLSGLQQTLARFRPVLVIEISYGEDLSFTSAEQFMAHLPQDYRVYTFDTRKVDGSTARRRGARAKRTGAYRLIPLTTWRDKDQDDLVAIPEEKLEAVPLRHR